LYQVLTSESASDIVVLDINSGAIATRPTATIRQAWQSAAPTAVTPAVGDFWLAAMSELVENNPQP